MLHFIETPLFTKQIKDLTDDDTYRDLQEDLIKNPEQGDLIQGTGGVRKPAGLIHQRLAKVAVCVSFIIMSMITVKSLCCWRIQSPKKPRYPLTKKPIFANLQLPLNNYYIVSKTMKNEFYDDLSLSLSQALSIAKGELEPSRVFSYDVPDIKAIRAKTGLTQAQFADKLNISSRTLQNWEQGTRNPTGATITLMRLLEKQPNLLSLA